MNMQNVEMEFVTFGAQDVIVTSPGLQPLAVTQATAYAYNHYIQDNHIEGKLLKSKSGVEILSDDYKTGSKWLLYENDGDNWSSESGAQSNEPSNDYLKPDKNSFDVITSWLLNVSDRVKQ